jgi:hypothetical protein
VSIETAADKIQKKQLSENNIPAYEQLKAPAGYLRSQFNAAWSL